MSIFSGMNVSATGMTAQRFRMDVISENIANVNTTRDEMGMFTGVKQLRSVKKRLEFRRYTV